jgi:hypothetical protein
MRAQIIADDEGYAPSGARPGDSSPHLGAEDIGGAAWGQPTLKPAVTPVDEPEAIDFVVGPRRFNQALAAPAFAAPDAGQGGMERQLDLILQVDIGPGQEGQQCGQIGWHVFQQIGLDKVGDGWRRRRAGPGQDHLHPQAFPT